MLEDRNKLDLLFVGGDIATRMVIDKCHEVRKNKAGLSCSLDIQMNFTYMRTLLEKEEQACFRNWHVLHSCERPNAQLLTINGSVNFRFHWEFFLGYSFEKLCSKILKHMPFLFSFFTVSPFSILCRTCKFPSFNKVGEEGELFI